MKAQAFCPVAFLFLLVLLAGNARCDQIIPGNILDPKTAREAWNVIRLATKNVERLIEDNRLAEIPVQISYCSPALRALPQFAKGGQAVSQVGPQMGRALALVNSIAGAAIGNQPARTREGLADLRKILDGVALHFDPETVRADIFFCPMHSEFPSEDAKAPCPKCGMTLLSRRIPYSFIYAKPGEPSVRMTASVSAPLEAGRKIEVKVRMERADRSPVLLEDLLEMHTERIHFLIEEPGLGDYHHEHPKPTSTPGEYVFSFTPGKTVPYRLWADIVPAASGVQELPFVDLPSAGKAEAVTGAEDRYTSSAGGYLFTLALERSTNSQLVAHQARRMGITVTDAKGKPVTSLEPVMNAFAHLVGFYSDYQTVVHLHPTGGDILNPEFRGGPALGFIFFPPKSGFVRLYCQVRIDGKMIFAPFNLNVEAMCAPPGK